MSGTEAQPDCPKFKLRWYQYSLRSLLIFTAVLAFLLGIAVHFRTHLVVRYMTARAGLADVKAIPASPMPDAPEPRDWVRCRFGSLEFSLPPVMAGNVEIPKNGAPLRAFWDGSKSIVVSLPEATGVTDEILETNLKLPPQGQGMSLPRLKLAYCQASSADFRWTMSQDEVRWHAWCIAMSGILRLKSDGWAETMFRADVDGIVFFGDSRDHAAFDWQEKNKAVRGFIHFKDRASELDPIWVRCVCQSVRFCEEPHSGESSKDKVPLSRGLPK